MEGFEEIVGKADEEIDRLVKELDHVTHLRQCDRIVFPGEIQEEEDIHVEDNVNNEDYRRANNKVHQGAEAGEEHLESRRMSLSRRGGPSASSTGLNFSQRFDVLEKKLELLEKRNAERTHENKEIKNMLADISKDAKCMVKMHELREAGNKKLHVLRRKRKAGEVNAVDVAQKWVLARKK